MKNHFFKKALSVLVAVLLVMSILPMTAFAAEVPTGAVAYVTDAAGQPIDAEGEGGDDLGGGYYMTLQAAIAADLAASKIDGYTGSTITMLKTVTYTGNTGYSIAAGQNISLDLNDCGIIGVVTANAWSQVIKVNKGATLTVSDSGTKGNGYISNVVSGFVEVGEWWKTDENGFYDHTSANWANNVIQVGGTFTLDSGLLLNNAGGSICFAIDTSYNEPGHVTINGGQVKAVYASAIRFVLRNDNPTLDINGGTIDRIWAQPPSNSNIGGTIDIENAIINDDIQIGNSGYPCKGVVVNIKNTQVAGGILYNASLDVDDNTITVSGVKAKNLKLYGPDETSEHKDKYKVLSDGYFMSYIPADYIVDGYYCIPNPDTDVKDAKGTTYTYKIADYYVAVDSVAEVYDADGNYVNSYPALDEAIKDAQAGQTVKLLKDITTESTVTIDKNLILDLDNHKIFAKSNYCLYPKTGVTLTIANGTITDSGYSNGCQLISPDSGTTIRLDNVTVNATALYSYPICSTSGNVTVEACEGSRNKLNASGYYYGIFSYGAVYITGTGSLDITAQDYGIYVSDYYRGENGTNYAVKIDNPNVVISETDDYYTTYAIYAKPYSTGAGDSTAVIITGGEYSGDRAVYSSGACGTTSADFEISGGTFDGYVQLDNPTVDVIISGGEFNDFFWDRLAYADTKISGGKFDGGFEIDYNGGDITIDGGEFTWDVNIGVYTYYNDGNVIINDGTFNRGVYISGSDSYSNYGDVVVNGGTFSSINNGDGDYSLYVDSGAVQWDGDPNTYVGSATINGGTFANDVRIIDNASYEGDYLSVTGGRFGGAEGVICDAYNGVKAKVISGGIFANDSYGAEWSWAPEGGYKSAWTECIDPAYAKAANDDDNTKVQYPFTVKPLEIKVNPETIENADKKDIEGNDLPEAAEEKVEEALENTLNNSAVGLFVETGIDDATKTKTVTSDNFNISMVLDAVKEAAKDASKNLASDTAVDENAKASGNGQITIKDEDITDMMIDKKVNVDLEASKIEVTMDTQNPEQVSMTTVNGATFDVKPTATVTITDGTGEVISKVTAVIPNEAITKPITFRLPVDPQIGANLKIASVWHSDDKDNFKKDYLGIFPIQCENGEYFIELSAKEFSYYTYENMKNITETHVAVIRDINGNYTGFDTLKDAIAAFNDGVDEDPDTVDNAVAIILLDDIQAGQNDEPASFDFDNKVVELDLNGYLFTADPAEGTGVTNATGVTVINSDDDMAKKRLAATGIYANDVSEFIVDGYDTRTTKPEDADPAVGDGVVENEVFNNTSSKTFTIEVITSTETDHDSSNNDATLHEENRVDVYADEYVGVKVVVNGARFTAADVTLTWDTSLFEDDTAVWDLPNGWNEITDNNGNIIGWRFTSPKDSDSYYPAGTILGEFSFKALYINESKINGTDNLCTFTVKNNKDYSHDAKVIGSWGITLADDSTDPVPPENLYDDSALIMLMNSMTGAVEGKTNLIYKGSDINQKLLNDKYNGDKGWSAKVGGQEYGNATIEYAVLTPDNAKLIGENKPDSEEKYTLDDFLTYSDDLPTGKDAGEYTVYYRIMADGYQTVENSVKVTIAKQKVNLEWIAPVDFTGSGSIFTGEYNATGFNAPTAKFSNLDGGDTVLDPSEILWTSGPNDDKTLKDVGEYTFTAQDQKNYEFNNPTATVKVTGKAITGWALEATGNGTIYQADGETVDKSQGVIWRDGTAYAIGELKIADNASVKYTAGEYKDADNNVLQNVKLVYEYSEDNGHTWLSVPENDPSKLTYDELGTRKLRLTVTADNYEKLVLDATFTIKNPIFKVENLEYVAGYSIVLVYTNEDAVSFKYDNQMLYDVSIFGYKYNNNNYYNGTEQHAHVFGYVIKGAADISKIYASNDDALQLNLPENYNSSTESFVNDVNNKTTASVDLDDITAVQSIYVANAENIADIQLALRSDVNRDKRVDVNGDVSQVSAYYLAS